MSLDPISWRDTRERLRQDRERLCAFEFTAQPAPRGLIFYPPYTSVWLHRLSHFFHRRGHRWVARLLWHLNLLATGADIGPSSDIGGGLVVLNPVAIVMYGKAGRNLTVMAFCGLGTLPSREDIGAGPGLPVLGDGVELAPFSGVLGPVRIGDGVRIGAGCIVTEDLPDHAVVAPAAPRARSNQPLRE